jgi:hypothetical protein
VIQKSVRFKNEPFSEPLHISVMLDLLFGVKEVRELISQKVFAPAFCQSKFTYKSVISTAIKNELRNFCGN